MRGRTVVIVGAGSGGIVLANRLRETLSPEHRIIIIERSETHAFAPSFLWLMCPVLIYWISRVWILAHRGELDDDPLVFAVKDRVSWLACAVSLVIFTLATTDLETHFR